LAAFFILDGRPKQEGSVLKKRYDKAGGLCTVTFSIPPEQAAGATCAHLVGDFTNWDRNALPMKRTKDAGFQISISLDVGREFLFRYLFDNSRWDNDWQADRYVTSPYHDSENSIVAV